MSIHPQEHVPISQSPVRRRRRRSDIAIPVSMLAFVVMLGVGITAFSTLPTAEPSTVGVAVRAR